MTKVAVASAVGMVAGAGAFTGDGFDWDAPLPSAEDFKSMEPKDEEESQTKAP
eukprot:CAMPEP_0176122244 /NCGR_PEP_ID=MMETSP0120_2-20121206/61564_1 /TAXON_ID=160619 /ORGANISM="Kryptoperidinium foliaceum, Strain CCMP 1326" /LENGTH=52 /DNA_ID=CAMNT_0017456861 /DNA_START=76 /DNA_END=230 /DNA_ORIENTATION=-